MSLMPILAVSRMRNTSFFEPYFLKLFRQYQNPSLNLLLYGDKALSPEINTTLFEKVQAFIFKTKRFQPLWV